MPALGLEPARFQIAYGVPWKGTIPQRVRIPPGKLSLQPVAIEADDGGNDKVRDGKETGAPRCTSASATGDNGGEQELVRAYAWIRCADAQGIAFLRHPIQLLYDEMYEACHEHVEKALARADELSRLHCANAP